MIITKTPYRVSFFGGGTDYQAWFQNYGGSVLSSTINKYCYVSCRFQPPFFCHKSRVVWQKVEEVASNKDIAHPVVRAALEYLKIDQGLSIHHEGDLPARTGLGSSSAFTVGLLGGLFSLLEKKFSKKDLVKAAYYLEKELLKEEVGLQDQVATAFGGINIINFNKDSSFSVNPLELSSCRVEDLENNLMLFFTGITRSASSIAHKKVTSFKEKQSVLQEMASMVSEAKKVLLSSQDIKNFGLLLHETWKLKRSITSSISTDLIDDLYTRALKAGALGGKVLGAGGGGFFLLFVPPERRQSVLEGLKEFLYVPIKFEFSGTQTIFENKDQYSQRALYSMDFFKKID